MRRFDKLKNIKKANLLAEQRYMVKLNESTDVDLINFVVNNIQKFWVEQNDFDKTAFSLEFMTDKIEGVVFNGTNLENIVLQVRGTYDVTSRGYYSPGKSYGPPEDSYPDESESPEFDIVINNFDILTSQENGLVELVELEGSDVQKLPKELLGMFEEKVTDMLLDSGDFDPSNRNDDYDDPDDDYDPSDTEAREWGGMDI